MLSAILLVAASGVVLAYVFFADLSFLKDWAGMREYMIAFAVWMLVPFLFSPYATLPIVYRRQKQFFLLATLYQSAVVACAYSNDLERSRDRSILDGWPVIDRLLRRPQCIVIQDCR